MQHQQRLVHIILGVCASVGRHLHCPSLGNTSQGIFSSSKICWPTTCSINQGLHTSIVMCSCQHREIKIDQWLATSSTPRAFKESNIDQCHAISSRLHQTQIAPSVVACAHAQPTTYVGCPHQLRPLHITEQSQLLIFPIALGLHIMTSRCQTLTTLIGRSFHITQLSHSWIVCIKQKSSVWNLASRLTCDL